MTPRSSLSLTERTEKEAREERDERRKRLWRDLNAARILIDPATEVSDAMLRAADEYITRAASTSSAICLDLTKSDLVEMGVEP